MPIHVTDEVLRDNLRLVKKYGTPYRASKATGEPATTILNRMRLAAKRGIKADSKVAESESIPYLKEQIRQLKAQISEIDHHEIMAEDVRRKIFNLSRVNANPPAWSVKPPKKHKGQMTPHLLLSDLHWGEVIDAKEIMGINEYNLRIAHERMRHCVNTCIDLWKNHLVNDGYPGFHLWLVGDLFSGTLHDLQETNAAPMMRCFTDLFDTMVWAIDALLSEFPKVHVVGVVGNHGRTSFKPKTKQRALTNFDWLLCTMLEKHYTAQGNKDITFNVPESADALVKVFNHDYLISHGDQAKGGGGWMGPKGPMMRMDAKKRARNMQVGLDYHTHVVGHWHTYMSTPQIIMNGSMPGYNEFAFLHNMDYERACQATWATHSKLGIVWPNAIYLED